MTPREFDLMCEGYEERAKETDKRLAYFFTMATNVHLKPSSRIKIKNVMNALHPKTAKERKLEEEEFIREWIAEGGETDG